MRKIARRIAFLLIYAYDMGNDSTDNFLGRMLSEEGLGEFITTFSIDENENDLNLTEEELQYIRSTVQDVINNIEEVDAVLAQYTEKWTLDRMLSTDRNILRLSSYELLKNEPAKRPIFINEGVELAKVYGEESSFKFVNAILDKIAKQGDMNECRE